MGDDFGDDYTFWNTDLPQDAEVFVYPPRPEEGSWWKAVVPEAEIETVIPPEVGRMVTVLFPDSCRTAVLDEKGL